MPILTALLALTFPANETAAIAVNSKGDGTVYMIRHGEKDSKGCESSKGMERAHALHDIFKDKFHLPDYIYAYHYSHECQRTTQTITPLAESLGLEVDVMAHADDSAGAVKEFISRLSSADNIVACWEHNHILKVAESFGVPSHKIPSWHGSNYDTVFIFTIKSGKLVDFKVSAEDFHSKLDVEDVDEEPESFRNQASTPSHMSMAKSDAMSFLVIGDWGGRSEHEVTDAAQIAGAAGMAKVADQLGGVDFVVSVGDHFYEGGIKGDAHDKRFKETFEDVYHQQELQVPWYVVAGNHDHSGNIQAQIDYSNVSDRWNYPHLWHTFTKSVTIDGEEITSQFVALDLVVMMGMHDDDQAVPGPHYWDMEPHPMQAHADKQFKWFDQVMNESTADYLWVYGHYPMYNADGPHDSLVRNIGEQMTKYKASGYFSGHEHTMFQLSSKDGGIAYICQGAGSRGVHKKQPPAKPFAGGVKWDWGHTKQDKSAESGFTSVLVGKSKSTLRYHNEKGDILYSSAIPSRH